MTESKRRIMVKSVLWGILGTLVSGVTSQALVNNWYITISIMAGYGVIRTVLFYIYNWAWSRIIWDMEP